MKLKAYIAYNGYCYSEERIAILIFHYTAKEAKKLAWQEAATELVDGEYIDLVVKWMKDSPWLMEEKTKDEPHVIWSPKSCNACFGWGHTVINENGLCGDCNFEIDDQEE